MSNQFWKQPKVLVLTITYFQMKTDFLAIALISKKSKDFFKTMLLSFAMLQTFFARRIMVVSFNKNNWFSGELNPCQGSSFNSYINWSFSISVFYHSTDPTAYDNDLTILKMDVASICGGKKDENPVNLRILIVLEVFLLVLILTKVRLDNYFESKYVQN